MADKRKLPIDIQYKQLLEALVDRRIVPQKWLEQHKQLRDAVAALYPALPAASDALDKLRAKKPSHEDMNYFDCKLVLELLAASDEGQSKNFFGQYTSPVLKQWSALVRQYEKNNVFAAEAARIIAQNTAFEIPFLKKTMQQNEKQVADNNRKIQDLNKSIAEYKRKLEAACAAMGIPGDNFRAELQRLPLELPAIFQAAADTLCSDKIAGAIEYHESIQTYLHNCEVPTAESGSGEVKSKKGGEVEESFELVSAPHRFFTALKELKEADATMEDIPSPVSLDFEAEAAEISWDITLDDSGAAAGADTIDWGIETVAATEGEGTEQAPAEIDWDITTSDISAEITTVDEGTPVDEPQLATRVGLLSDSDFRTRVLNDLQELRAFLRQREVELLDETNQVQDSLHKLEQQSIEAVRGFQSVVASAIAELTSKRLQQLVLIQTSDRYLDRQVTSLEMLTKQMDKSRREIGTLEDKNADLIDATSRRQPQIDALVAATKKLKRELEAALPPLFKGYKVNIIGEVNSL